MEKHNDIFVKVALFTRAWIEILPYHLALINWGVALFTRAWIEMSLFLKCQSPCLVALFTRAWIEIAIRPSAFVQ